MRKPRKKAVAVVAITVALLGVGGTAFAYWTGGGTGNGEATTLAAVSAVNAVQTSSITAMQPGDAAQLISGNFNNLNSGPTYVTNVTASIDSVTKATGAPAGVCDSTDYTLASASMAVGREVPAGTAKDGWGGATIKFNNKTDTNQDACKGATVNLAYVVE